MNKKIKLNLGCGKYPLENYINIDLYEDTYSDYKDDIRTLSSIVEKYGLNSIDEIYSAHSLMCIEESGLSYTLKNWYNLLKIGGILIIETTDLDKQINEYNRGKCEKVVHSLFGDNQQDGLGIRYQFNFNLLNYWLKKAGFKNIEKIKQPEYSRHNEKFNLCVKAIK